MASRTLTKDNLIMAVMLVTAFSVFGGRVQSALADEGLSDDRKAELANLLEQDCGSCHGLTMKGGLGSPLLPEVLAEKGDDILIDIILNGIEGTPMPPWKALLSKEDAGWIVQQIRKGKPGE